MSLDPALRRILVCPQDRGELLLVEDELLYNPRLRRAYPIRDGVPVMLTGEARDVEGAEHDDLLTRATPA
ncbi:MAG: Trm112 family protein [Nocardioidaceae bacterium]|nr:Trm112 family protein [Nocardioidaceae bacterium]